MSAVQPDLFGDLDREEEARRRAAEQRERDRQPATCPACGATEPLGLLRRNHTPMPGGECIARYLVGNHIRYAARHDEPEYLAQRMERGRQLGLDVDAILAEVRQEATP